uniref:NADH dehydrogenase [ubiquinone] 1 beta subcomplex subunit 8, mitochondrial n=1 Tax=Panagrolaimus sp. ES5 TaxID=591445 RepID=A0AC34GR11_9BILA
MSNLFRVSSRAIHTTPLVARGPLTFEGWFPRDHKPGPYPTTEKERRAAAIKYGLRPEDYRPIDPKDLNRHAGDYPEAEIVTFDHKDPYENWTDHHHKRNWGELVGIDMMTYRGDRITFTGLDAEDYKPLRAFFLILRVIVPMAIFTYWYSNSNPNGGLRWKNPVLPKQYPYDFYRAFPWNDPQKYPIVNYSFEPVD